MSRFMVEYVQTCNVRDMCVCVPSAVSMTGCEVSREGMTYAPGISSPDFCVFQFLLLLLKPQQSQYADYKLSSIRA